MRLPSGPTPSVDWEWRIVQPIGGGLWRKSFHRAPSRLLRSLDMEDNEHPDVALKHETEWCLSAYPGGLLVWENAEVDEGIASI